MDRALDELEQAIEAWDPPDEAGFTKADYRSEDFDPLAMLRSGKRRPQPRQKPMTFQESCRFKRGPLEPSYFIGLTTNNTGPK